MTTLNWIAVAFAAGLLIFMMITFFIREPTPQQAQTLRFFSALTAGLLGGTLIAGNMDLRLSGNVELLEIAGTFGGGAALAVLIWVTYPRYAPTPTTGVSFKVVPASTFANTARALAQMESAAVEFDGFSLEQLETALQTGEYHAHSIEEALATLQHIATKPLPRYKVEKQNHNYAVAVT